jgi:uncharacterized membrane protein YuzA (DUF378 family)
MCYPTVWIDICGYNWGSLGFNNATLSLQLPTQKAAQITDLAFIIVQKELTNRLSDVTHLPG